MGRSAINPSASVAKLMRDRRIEMGWSLRDVQRETEAAGTPIPYATLCKVEQGKVDPGVKRLHVLLRLYRLPVQLAADLLEMEDFAGDLPPETTSIEQLQRDGVEHWQKGRLQKGMACLLAIRERQPDDWTHKNERHEALLSFSIAAKGLGKIRLAAQIVENLLLERPDPDLLVNVLVQAATCWHQRGSPDAALGFLMQAETYIAAEDHKKRAWVFHQKARVEQSEGRLTESEKALEIARTAYEKSENHFGLCQISGLQISLAMERSDFATALTMSVSARNYAAARGFDRLRILRRIDEGRARFASGQLDEGLRVLQAALGEAVAGNDNVLAFHGHHALWKAYAAQGDHDARADMELSAAQYYARFVDEFSAEVKEVRQTDDLRQGGRRWS